MADIYFGDSYLITFFQQFYKEVICQKQRALDYPSLASQEAPGEEIARFVDSIQKALLKIIETQNSEAIRHGGDYALTNYREAQYIMVALADEVFLTLNWPGRPLWERRILEAKVFNTHIAGEIVFEKIEDFLKIRDPAHGDLARLYLLALGLGFKGKYQGGDNEKRLPYYRNQLFTFIAHHEPKLYQRDTCLFPEAYAQILEEGSVKMLPDPKIWYGILGMCLSGFLILSYSLWYTITHEIDGVVKNILSETGTPK